MDSAGSGEQAVDENAPTNLLLRAVQPAAQRSEEVVAEVADRPPTHLEVAVVAGQGQDVDGEELDTSLYHPKVEVLLARLDDDLAIEYDDAGEHARYLRNKIADLHLLRDNYEDLDDEARIERRHLERAARRMLDDLSDAIDRAGLMLAEPELDDGLIDDGPIELDLSAAREDAVRTLFSLRKWFAADTGEDWGVIDEGGGEEIELNAERRLEREREERKQEQRQAPKPRRRLKAVAALLLFGIAAARLALFFSSPPPRAGAATVVRGRSAKGVLTANRRTTTTSDIARGVPTMVLVDLFRDGKGDLVANPMASHPSGKHMTYGYAWMKDGRRLSSLANNADRLPLGTLTSGSYQVVVWAISGDSKSEPMRSASLRIR